MLEILRRVHTEIKAYFVRWFRVREVVKVLRITHANELSEVNISDWAITKQRQAREIAAVRKGNFGVVDRRSWQYPYIPEALHRLNQPILKNTPYNIRRFSETPIPRRAINIIKNSVLQLGWRARIGDDYDQQDPDLLRQVKIVTDCFEHPNNSDSYRTLMEAVLEDFIIGGYGCIEPQMTPHYERPIKMWAVDGSTIRIFGNWTESTPELPHYAQLTGLKGERGIVSFLDDELLYLRDNVRSSTPFGLGCIETCFTTINAFLGAQDMSSRAGSDQIHKTWLWWKNSIPTGQFQTIQRHIQNEAEGQAKVSMATGLEPPQVVEITPVNPEDLLLEWQQFLIRIIAAGCNLSAMALGIENDVNRATSQTLSEMDFQYAVVPVARKFEEALTRFLLHRFLGWKEMVFEYVGLDDPDAMVQMGIFQMAYRMDAITPDEIREATQLGPALPGGWGKLTWTQKAILIGEATGRPPTGLNTASGGGAGGSGMGGGGGMGAAAVTSLSASPFNADDVAQMHPNDVQMYQQQGMLPPNPQLQQQMEQEQPGILEQITDELAEYFEKEEELTKKAETKPAPVTPEDEKEQIVKYKASQHDISPEEQFARYIERHRVQLQTRDPFGAPKGKLVTDRNVAKFRGPKSGGWSGRFR